MASFQGLGLTIGNLGWQVPQDEMDAASRRARLRGASKLRLGGGRRQRPLLGLSIAGYQDIDLTGGAVPPTPFYARPRPMMMAAMAAPIATPDAQNVTHFDRGSGCFFAGRGTPLSPFRTTDLSLIHIGLDANAGCGHGAQPFVAGP